MSTLITQEGFLFAFAPEACQKCGGFCCCGESGYIFLTSQEMEGIAAFLGMELERFGALYLKKVGTRYSLIEKREKGGKGYACIFFDEEAKECMIYEHRPKQCRDFPFWESNRGQNLDEVIQQCPFLEPL
jgi:Fe-S-cluster containining protein